VSGWQPGDRVQVKLPDKKASPRGRVLWFYGTVREVDPPGMRPGVIVDLGEPVNGVTVCFATHAELKRIEAGP
jgi:hypothetical protein